MEMKSQLHWTRARQKDPKDPFLDEFADIKFVVKQALAEAPVIYMEKFKDKEKADYLQAVLSVFLCRLEEDPQPLDYQMEQFKLALNKFPKEQLSWLLDMFGLYILCVFALFYRRDIKTDRQYKTAFTNASALLTMRQLIKEDTYNKMKEELVLSKEFLEDRTITVTTVNAKCVEDGEIIENIKDKAALYMNATGSNKWEDVAAACDQFVVNCTDDDKAVAVALAYPDYPTPYFEVTVDNEK